jgi:hypothetical protein
MQGKNLLWVAKQHGHSVEVMLRMYAAWLEGATDSDIHAIKQAMEKRPAARAAFLDSRTAISSINAATNRVAQIVIRPLKSPEFGSRLAVGKDLSDSSLRNDSKIEWRRGCFYVSRGQMTSACPSICSRSNAASSRVYRMTTPA